MARRIRDVLRWVCVVASAGWVLQAGCVRDIQRELEVLVRPEANATLIRDSFLVEVFGPEILSLFT